MLRHTFTAALGAAVALLLAILATSLAAAGGRDPVPQNVATTDLGSIVASRVYTRAQVSSGSLNLKNLRGGAIHITGVAKPVQQAFLYWSVVSKGAAPETAGALRIQRIYPYPVSRDVEIKGIAVATGPNLCRKDAYGGGTVTIFRGVVPLAVANGNGSYVIQLNSDTDGLNPAWRGALLAVVGSGGAKIGLFDSALPGRTSLNQTVRTLSLPLGGDCMTPAASIVAAVPETQRGLAEGVSKPSLQPSYEAPSARASLPDLIPTRGYVGTGGLDQEGDNVIVGRRFMKLKWYQQTENRSEATVPAAKSKTALKIEVGDRFTEFDRVSIPELDAGLRMRSTENFEIDLLDWKFGTYVAKLCADIGRDVSEMNEDNNCWFVVNRLHVVPKSFTGTVTGAAVSFGKVVINWQADVTYTLAEITDDRAAKGVLIDYTITRASVKYEVSGTQSGCTWRGTGTDRPSGQDIRLFFSDKEEISHYFAAHAASAGFYINTTVKCPGAPPLTFPLAPSVFWFVSSSQPFANPGRLKLIGELRTLTTHWVWRFSPHD